MKLKGADRVEKMINEILIAAESVTTELTSPPTGDIALFLTAIALFCVSVVVALAKHRRNKEDK